MNEAESKPVVIRVQVGWNFTMTWMGKKEGADELVACASKLAAAAVEEAKQCKVQSK